MKKISVVFILMLFAFNANSASINSGGFNAETNKVELNVSYTGGCSQHTFKLELVKACKQTHPVQCKLNLNHSTDKPETCKANLNDDLELDLPNDMAGDDYYKGAIIRILDSKVSFQLP